jgi:hypothetical protein
MPAIEPMDRNALRALKASIKAWEGKKRRADPDKVSTGVDACPLCDVFYGPAGSRCQGCPIKERTGLIFCDGSPYEAAHKAYAAWHKAAMEWGLKPPRTQWSKHEWRKAAQAEIDFLKSLLPEGESA